ncbi:hypothetical protein, partial [Phenylobacterium sp.]|uniref:hypothetical protein n=1 Tax=Phenylobacterium sp. TaxID=1871053 RepID=UPI0025EF703E
QPPQDALEDHRRDVRVTYSSLKNLAAAAPFYGCQKFRAAPLFMAPKNSECSTIEHQFSEAVA